MNKKIFSTRAPSSSLTLASTSTHENFIYAITKSIEIGNSIDKDLVKRNYAKVNWKGLQIRKKLHKYNFPHDLYSIEANYVETLKQKMVMRSVVRKYIKMSVYELRYKDTHMCYSTLCCRRKYAWYVFANIWTFAGWIFETKQTETTLLLPIRMKRKSTKREIWSVLPRFHFIIALCSNYILWYINIYTYILNMLANHLPLFQ